jgi:hypothetical protein
VSTVAVDEIGTPFFELVEANEMSLVVRDNELLASIPSLPFMLKFALITDLIKDCD